MGDPHVSLVYWKKKPAAHASFFPFPLWADGRPIVAGKPECAALHPAVAFCFPRPDLFGLAVCDLRDRARDLGWPLVIGRTNARARSSIAKHSFQDVPMPAATIIWPLQGKKLWAEAHSYLSKRSSRLSWLTRNTVGRFLGRCGAKAFVLWPRLLAGLRGAAALAA